MNPSGQNYSPQAEAITTGKVISEDPRGTRNQCFKFSGIGRTNEVCGQGSGSSGTP